MTNVCDLLVRRATPRTVRLFNGAERAVGQALLESSFEIADGDPDG